MGNNDPYQPPAPQQQYPADHYAPPPHDTPYPPPAPQQQPHPQPYAQPPPQQPYAQPQPYAQQPYPQPQQQPYVAHPPYAAHGHAPVAHPAVVVAPQPTVILRPIGRPIGESGDICLGVLLAMCIGCFGYLAMMSSRSSHRLLLGLHAGHAGFLLTFGAILTVVGFSIADETVAVWVIGACFVFGGLVFLALAFQTNGIINRLKIEYMQAIGAQPGVQYGAPVAHVQMQGAPPQPQYAQAQMPHPPRA